MKHTVVFLIAVMFFLTSCSSSSSSSNISSGSLAPVPAPINKDAEALKDFQKDLDTWYQKNNVQ